jgi:thymidylate synthase
MQQYLDLLRTIKEKGTYKPAAREGMPGTLSLFGHQMRFDLQKGFPAITTKKLYWKGVVTELLWFLRGDTNIKYLVDKNCNIWNEDAYNYYCKVVKNPVSYEQFEENVKGKSIEELRVNDTYIMGDCGFQYGKLWRDWKYTAWNPEDRQVPDSVHNKVDQIKDLIEGLKKNPMGRRHIITSWNPATLDKMALNACHALVQFNCRPLTNKQRLDWVNKHSDFITVIPEGVNIETQKWDDFSDITFLRDGKEFKVEFSKAPKYYLDCQMYQRSADVFLGVPFNIASYALLTHIIAKFCNMQVGDFVHTFGDVHIYDNHMDAVNEQLTREPLPLPKLEINPQFIWDIDADPNLFHALLPSDFTLKGYQSHSAIKAELSTGLKK